jgi:hypothetical protein
MKLIQFLIMMFFYLQVCEAQIAVKEPEKLSELPTPTGFKLYFIITENGDTLPIVTLHPVSISENRTFANKREERKWSRLKRDVAKVYPYSKIAGKKLRSYNDMMVGKPELEQNRLLKRAESELKKEFEGDIRNMTLNQGRILIKLIDRETGNSSYSLVKELRGSFQAFFWQSLARVFSTNLKETFNPYKNPEDKMIEDIIGSIEDGSFVN